MDSASYFLDINSNGDLVTRVLADLDLNSSMELLTGGEYNDDNQHSMISCDTAELLRTPSPCVAGSEQEAESAETENVEVKVRDGSRDEMVDKDQEEHDQWADSNHRENSQGFSMQMNSGIQSMADIPATSTPKKQKALSSDNQEILEGRYKGSAYHRDGTRVG